MVNVPVTAPVVTTLQIQWSKVNTGATGSAGAAAFNLSVYSPTGTVFTNGLAENSDEVTLTALYFQGATDLTTNTKSAYLWEKYESGSWTMVKAEATGSSGNTYTVHAADVQGSATYRCRARYNNGTTYFYDTITIVDKTDNYQADIDSTAGDVFKNTVGQTCLIPIMPASGFTVCRPPKPALNPAFPKSTGSRWRRATGRPTTPLPRRMAKRPWN